VTERYRLQRSVSTAGEFHARAVPVPAQREIWFHDVSAPALVLGSTQPDAVVDHDACRRAGVAVVRRRSGGGAVLLRPGEVTWIDVIVPRGARGWSDDIHGPMVWLGRHLADAFAAVDAQRSFSTHVGPMETTPWSSLVCFDGVGAGEVLVGGAKLVGISQRRTRDAARLQCCWYSRHDPSDLIALLAPQGRPAVGDLRPVAVVPDEFARAVPTALATRL
jgi:lipoate---protein ligase